MKTRRKLSTHTTIAKPQPQPMADISQVWIVRPAEWPQPTAEAMAADARKRARFYVGSKFWRDGHSKVCSQLHSSSAPKVQQELFDA